MIFLIWSLLVGRNYDTIALSYNIIENTHLCTSVQIILTFLQMWL